MVWLCGVCTFENGDARSRCEMCETPNPAAPSKRSTSLVVASPPSGSGGTRGTTGGTARPDALYVSEFSQFTFGGESACPFGTLELGRLLLDGVLDPAADSKIQAPIFTEALQTAVRHYTSHFKGRASAHASPFEIVRDFPHLFKVELVMWPSLAESPMGRLHHAIVFPDAFLPGGELQLENATDRDIRTLLECFQGANVVLCVVNIGYVFGVYCRADRSFVVFDTHSKNLSAYGGSSGAFMAHYRSLDHAYDMMVNFVLSSRAEILKHAFGDVNQASAAQNMDIVVIRGHPSVAAAAAKKAAEAKATPPAVAVVAVVAEVAEVAAVATPTPTATATASVVPVVVVDKAAEEAAAVEAAMSAAVDAARTAALEAERIASAADDEEKKKAAAPPPPVAATPEPGSDAEIKALQTELVSLKEALMEAMMSRSSSSSQITQRLDHTERALIQARKTRAARLAGAEADR